MNDLYFQSWRNPTKKIKNPFEQFKDCYISSLLTKGANLIL